MNRPFRMAELLKCADCGMRFDPVQTEGKCPHKSRIETSYLAGLRGHAAKRPADVPLIEWLASK